MAKKILISVTIIVILLGISIMIGYTMARQTKNKSNRGQIDNYLKAEISNITDLETVDYTNKKYYLHKSNLEKPSNEICKIEQDKALEGLSAEERESVQEILRETHVYMEYLLIEAVRMIKEPDSPYWNKFTINAPYIDPYTGNTVISNGFYNNVDDLKKIEDIIKNNDTKENIKRIYNQLQNAMDNHDLEQCFKVHEKIHDYDYWIINYPVHFATFPPADWGGIDTYFGNIQ